MSDPVSRSTRSVLGRSSRAIDESTGSARHPRPPGRAARSWPSVARSPFRKNQFRPAHRSSETRSCPAGCAHRASRAGGEPRPACAWPSHRCNPVAIHSDKSAGASPLRRRRWSSHHARSGTSPRRRQCGRCRGHSVRARAGVRVVDDLQDLAELPFLSESVAGHRQVHEVDSDLSGERTLGLQLFTGHLEIDDRSDSVTIVGLRELTGGKLSAAVQHAALGLVPVVPYQAPLPVEDDQPPGRSRGNKWYQPEQKFASGGVLAGLNRGIRPRESPDGYSVYFRGSGRGLAPAPIGRSRGIVSEEVGSWSGRPSGRGGDHRLDRQRGQSEPLRD